MGIDLDDPRGPWRRRTWRWLHVRIIGMIDKPGSRLHAALTAEAQAEQAA